MKKKLASFGLLLALAGCGRQSVKTDDVQKGLDDVYSKFVATSDQACSAEYKDSFNKAFLALQTLTTLFKLEESAQ